MKRRGGDEDEAIRWPELNRHGDSNAHHALPARETGKHGIETSPLERTLSNSSSIFGPSALSPQYGAAPMALNGSSFGAPSLVEDHDALAAHGAARNGAGVYGMSDDNDDYTSFPPMVMPQASLSTGNLGFDTGSDEDIARHAGYGPGAEEYQMGMVSGRPVTYGPGS